MIDLERFKLGIAKIAEKYDLKLVVLYGSQATGKANENSDIDIAILGNRRIDFDRHIELINEFTGLFHTDEVDVKLLHSTNPLFRYQVMRDGILLFGKKHDFISFRAYAFRDYMDSRDLLRLKQIMIQSRVNRLIS